MSPSSSLDAGAWWRLVALSVLWGGSFFFVGVALRDLPPLTIVAARSHAGCNPARPRADLVRPDAAATPGRLGAACGDGSAQQRRADVADRVRPDDDLIRPGVGAERDHAVLHDAGAGRCRRRATDVAAPRRRAVRRSGRGRAAGAGHASSRGLIARRVAVPRRGVQLRPRGTLGAQKPGRHATACRRHGTIGGVLRRDGHSRVRIGTSVDIADAGPRDMAGAARPRTAVDGDRLHPVLSDHRPIGAVERHAGDADDSGAGDLARIRPSR